MHLNAIRIASYNIRKARGLDQRRRPERTLAVINALDADIVVLQEADRRLGRRPPALPRRMIEAETDFTLVELSANGTSLGWHGNAVLVRDPTTVERTRRVDLPGLEPRGAVLVDFAIGDGLSVIGAHLGLRRRDRLGQLAALDRLAARRGHTVIAGDFNEWSEVRGFEPLAERFVTHAPGLSFHARRPVAALDRFALSRDLRLKNAGVAQDALARRASDHLPIWSDIALPARTV
ncbi:endonuclease/exonuclease/phosphatase family protein [Maribius pontilimi]|uniref:Endonuclease/exonuclease/phosphatase family protein n=1 Tax=Palleronia pontilimi TaxID=1964209 RepID=A0A934IIT9_9RHOB|nr:endonuclease/exonuclease/phosphatase family protein [Palleronia pontilimi]MBJ3763723.1 endonuclease/exonuclease/phosphatase family protein [Palleronia pontilimi]